MIFKDAPTPLKGGGGAEEKFRGAKDMIFKDAPTPLKGGRREEGQRGRGATEYKGKYGDGDLSRVS